MTWQSGEPPAGVNEVLGFHVDVLFVARRKMPTSASSIPSLWLTNALFDGTPWPDSWLWHELPPRPEPTRVTQVVPEARSKKRPTWCRAIHSLPNPCPSGVPLRFRNIEACLACIWFQPREDSVNTERTP